MTVVAAPTVGNIVDSDSTTNELTKETAIIVPDMTETVDIDLPSGIVRGVRKGAGGEFWAVPYAAPPIGPLRFLPPQPVRDWEGTRDATRVGPTPPQTGASPTVGHLIPNVAIPGDDFLHVNIATPDVEGSAPVVVYIYGGSFVTGSNALDLYNGSAFARDGVVFVAINYRIGIDGFMLVDDAVPNRGLLDQVAALRWVHDTISRFGGDPEQVTVMGESAGAMSIGTLLAMPSARGLFRRAILQSGGAENTMTITTAETVRDRVATILGVAPTRTGLGTVSAESLLAVQDQVAAEVAVGTPEVWNEVVRHLLPFEPVVDGEIVPQAPRDALAKGAAADIDILTGYTADESRLFFFGTPEHGPHARAATDAMARRYGLSAAGLASYRAAMSSASEYDVLTAIVTDAVFRIPARRICASAGTRYLYSFAWPSPADAGKRGAAHAFELPFVFDNLDSAEAAGILAGQRPQELATRMHRAWVDFITTGNPGWPAYRDGGPERRFDILDETVDDPFAGIGAHWSLE